MEIKYQNIRLQETLDHFRIECNESILKAYKKAFLSLMPHSHSMAVRS